MKILSSMLLIILLVIPAHAAYLGKTEDGKIIRATAVIEEALLDAEIQKAKEDYTDRASYYSQELRVMKDNWDGLKDEKKQANTMAEIWGVPVEVDEEIYEVIK